MIEWKDVGLYKGVDFGGSYKVSNDGQVISIPREIHYKNKTGKDVYFKIAGGLLKPRKDKDGYLFVTLKLNGIEKKAPIHQLVALCFVQNPNNYPVVNHKNQTRDDNRAENLEWVTVQYNVVYMDAAKIRGKKLTEKYGYPIVQMDIDGNILKIWDNVHSAMAMGYSDTAIYSCLRDKKESHMNCRWARLSDISISDEDIEKYRNAEPQTVMMRRPSQRRKKVLQFDTDENFIAEWESLTAAAEGVGCSDAGICRAVHSKSGFCKGFIWRLKQ